MDAEDDDMTTDVIVEGPHSCQSICVDRNGNHVEMTVVSSSIISDPLSFASSPYLFTTISMYDNISLIALTYFDVFSKWNQLSSYSLIGRTRGTVSVCLLATISDNGHDGDIAMDPPLPGTVMRCDDRVNVGTRNVFGIGCDDAFVTDER